MEHFLKTLFLNNTFLSSFLLSFFFSFLLHPSFAQRSQTDTLLTLLKQDNEDTGKVEHLNKLAFALHLINPDSTILLAQQAAILAQKINFKQGEANAYSTAGVGYWTKGDYPKALENYFAALKIDELLLNTSLLRGNDGRVAKEAMAKHTGNIGLVYWNEGDYSKALDYYFRALKMDEELLNSSLLRGEDGRAAKNLITIVLGNVGLVYWNEGDYTKALDYYFKALKMAKELNNKNATAVILGNIGIAYKEQSAAAKSRQDIAGSDSLFFKALDYYFKALKMNEELGNKKEISSNLDRIGIIYNAQKDFTKAQDYYFKALKIAEDIGDKNHIAVLLSNIGALYTATGKFNEAEEYLLNAIAIDSSIGAQDGLRQDEELLSNLYDTLGCLAAKGKTRQIAGSESFYKRSLIHYKKAMDIRDTIFSAESKKQLVRKEMSYEFEKKQAAQKAEQEKQTAVATAESRKQKIIIWLFVALTAAAATTAALIFRSLRSTKKQKLVIEKQKELVDLRNKVIEEQKKLVENQKKQIEHKHKEQTDSITYAKRLQQAILPPFELFRKHLPNSFIIYKPKDIVAGDFYWMEFIDNYIFIAAADCTGHGVPGSLVSVVCSNALNRAVKEFGLRNTGKILDKVTDLVLETFEKSTSEVKDGMDISLLAYDMSSNQIQWSGANNPLCYIHDRQIVEIKADKQPVGKFDKRKPFTTHSIKHSGNSVFYLFTDGFADQFGGPKGRKFMYKQLKNQLTQISELSMNEQQNGLEKTFAEWTGNLEQVDDITVIGVHL